MNWDRIEGQWREMKGRVRERWGKLTDDDVDRIAGKRDQLVGTLQQRYGMARDEVDRQVREFEDGLDQASRAPQGQPDGEPHEAEPGRPARAPQRSTGERDARTHRRA